VVEIECKVFFHDFQKQSIFKVSVISDGFDSILGVLHAFARCPMVGFEFFSQVQFILVEGVTIFLFLFPGAQSLAATGISIT